MKLNPPQEVLHVCLILRVDLFPVDLHMIGASRRPVGAILAPWLWRVHLQTTKHRNRTCFTLSWSNKRWFNACTSTTGSQFVHRWLHLFTRRCMNVSSLTCVLIRPIIFKSHVQILESLWMISTWRAVRRYTSWFKAPLRDPWRNGSAEPQEKLLVFDTSQQRFGLFQNKF